MARYSITLNFLLPKQIVQKLKDIKISENFAFDWRNSNFCHCTVKAIALCDEIPKEIKSWAKESEKIISRQKSFKVSLKDVAKFPTAIFANVYSNELLKLHKKLSKILPSSQPQYENENYVPHVSIVGLSGDTKILSDLRQNFGEFEVKEIQLMIWDLNDLNKSQINKIFILAETS